MSEAPSPFSIYNPKLQVAWDSTSLSALMKCPRQYQYGILEGWRSPEAKVDLEFGGYFASATERYKKARLQGSGKTEATCVAVRYVIEATYSEDTGPWGGRYETMWRCTGSVPYRNARGNKAKCPYSHKGAWFPAPGPDVCGHCGSSTEAERQWISNNRAKDRYSLVRLVMAYCDDQADSPETGPYPYAFPNGQPAVELSFQMPLPWSTPGGYSTTGKVTTWGNEKYVLCGHLDSIMTYGEENFISDNKTTKNALGAVYFAQYSPNLQVDVYDLSGSVLYPDLALKGVMIEAAQTLAESPPRFAMGINYRSDALREELLGDLRYWLDQAERFASDNHWPMNRTACYMCPFKVVCSKEPEARQRYLEAVFVKAPWNPLKER